MQERVTTFTMEEYLGFEQASLVRHEYYQGEVFAMAGGSLNHNTIVGNLWAGLRQRLRSGGCRVFAENVKVIHVAERNIMYPDVVVVCGPVQSPPVAHKISVTNPQVIIEVLSDSTASFDRSGKFARYRKFDTLTEYVLVHQDRMQVEIFRKREGEWRFPESVTDGEVEIAGCRIPLEEIYVDVEW